MKHTALCSSQIEPKYMGSDVHGAIRLYGVET
jgi:hypothetical protein